MNVYRIFNFLNKYVLAILCLFIAPLAFGQIDENEQVQDTLNNVFKGKIELKDIDAIIAGYEYDAVTDTYVYTKSIEGFDIEFPLVLNREQYEDLLLKRNMRDYYRAKMSAVDGRASEEEQKDLLPRYRVNSGLFKSIFGSNTIDIKPTGSVEVDLGMRYTKQDNPMISPRNRSTLAMDFNPRISMSMQGKVGTNMDVNINYDTQATFGFQQQMIKLNYQPDEDDILQAIEVGNVSMPINNSLIRGAQNLFGVKTQLQFGATTITGVFSKQNSERKTIVSEGGGTVQNFELFALDYDANRHFFLSQYFRNKYDNALRNYPYIDSRVRITRVEVWITNRQNRVAQRDNNTRNIVAIQDLGEARLSNVPAEQIIGIDLGAFPDFVLTTPIDAPTSNKNNKFDPGQIGSNFLNNTIRQINTALGGFNIPVTEGRDFVKLENARKLTEQEFKFHPQLGYISLNQPMNNDEIVAVAYEYTIGDQVYRVGEFGTDGVDSTVIGNDADDNEIPTTQSLIVKLLKSSLTSTEEPVWDLMMKNIYQLPGAYQLAQDGFRFNILYTDPQPLNYIQPVAGTTLPAGVANTPLLNVFNLDRLNNTNDPQEGGDGYFDFVSSALNTDPFQSGNQSQTGGGGFGNNNSNQGMQSNNKLTGITVDAQTGRIIFTTVEPFGEHLFKKLSDNPSQNYEIDASYNENQKKYVFKTMYRSTYARALQESDKNKFQLKGRFKSEGGDGIPIPGFNLQPGSVVVTTSGRTLVEGQDYTVDYQRGRVNILDPGLAASNAQIEVSVESNNNFAQKQRTFFGTHIEHKFSENFVLGGTYLRLSERPMTVKSNFNDESVNNTIVGLNANFSSEAPFLTRLVNKLPNIDTDVPSTISFKGEFAYLMPGASKIDQLNGEATSYIDDFEGTSTNMDISAPNSWFLSSVPVGYGEMNTDVSSGYRRAKLSWYKIDQVFYSPSRRPNGINESDLSSNRTRRIYKEELFPSMDIAAGELLTLNTLDLTYYPKERGPYNYNPQFVATNELPNPQNNWAGIMRSIQSTNFEQSNVEYVEFWMMDPYTGNPGDTFNPSNQGEVYLNFGYISEDILQDGMKQYENGLPGADGNGPTISTIWGKVPASTALIYAFDNNANNRIYQDAGLDGILDEEEAAKFPDFAYLQDPAADNYEFFLTASGNVVERYKNYNGLQGNTPVEFSDSNRASRNLPDVEDIDGDNTMNTINAYFQYKVPVKPNPIIGENYVVDVRTTTATMQNGETTPVKWVQYKVPITPNPANAIGAISDLQSVRFMRIFLTGFTEEVTLRLATLDLVRSEWRKYEKTLVEDPSVIIAGTNTGFDVRTLNIIDNFSREPIPYIMPPGIERERVNQNNTIINQNEQSLSLTVYKQNSSIAAPSGLEPGDSRAVFKNVSVDMRQYKKLRMFLHAEALEPQGDSERLRDDELVAFIRFGNDFTQNFYQVEIPLKLTEWDERTAEQVWKIQNEIELSLDLLTKLKLSKNSDPAFNPNLIYFKNEDEIDPALAGKINKLRLGIKGNPNFGMVRTIMLGIRNQTDVLYASTSQRPRDLRGEVWFNELRVSDMSNKGGWAAVAALDTKIADFANLSVTGNKSTIGFGALEQGPQERSREDIFQYNVSTAVNANQLLPKKWNLTIPISYSISEETITPEYDPNNPDVKLKVAMDYANSESEKKAIKSRAIDYTKRTSINFIGVKKQRSEGQKERFYDVENLTFSHSYNRVVQHNFEIENMEDQQARSSVDYNYSFKPWSIEPFKKAEKFKKNSYLKLISDINLNIMPTNVMFNTNILRQLNQQQFRLMDVQGIEISPLYRRNYFFNYNYGANFNLTKKLNITYSVSNNNIVRNYIDNFNRVDNSMGIWDGYFDPGEANTRTQQFSLNYQLPFDKIPFLSFVNSTYSYTGDYSWQRSSDAFSSIDYEGQNYALGNTVQNANTHRLNTSFSMDKFYKYVGLVPSSQRKKTADKNKKPVEKPQPGQRIERNKENAANKKEDEKDHAFTDALIGVVTSLKTVRINYNETNGTVLPGYLPGLGFFGSSKPTLGFVFGSQADIRYEAARNGWLTNYPEYNQQFSRVKTQNLDFSAELRPITDLVIELSANRQYSNNMSEQFDVSADGMYNSRSPYEYGNFSISTIMINTAFGRSDINGSAAFDAFRENRLVIANRLATERGIDINDPSNLDQYGYPKGYGRTSQQVLIPAFLAAYTGGDAGSVSKGFMRKIPLPGWSLKYTGLMKIGWFKERFNKFSINHMYRSSYTVNAFQTNYDYYQNPDGLNAAGDYVSDIVASNINMIEQFNPLIRVEFEMKNAMSIRGEVKKDRALSMSFDNNLLTEVTGNEYIFGVGFRIKDVAFETDFEGVAGGRIVSDINVKADFSWRKNNTLIRYLDYNNNQIGAGQDIWSFGLKADYTFSKNFMGIFYYEHSFSKAVISTMYPITTVRSGFTLRYNFGN